jgi:hypothetical protein
MRKEVKQILEEFDFGKVADVMQYLEWEWHSRGVPNVAVLIISASEFLEEVYVECRNTKKDCSLDTGGFLAEAFYKEDSIKLSLKFVLTSWDNF